MGPTQGPWPVRFRIELMQQTWDPSLYAGNGRFVALLAESVVEALQPQPGERILDLGCGDGFLTRRIAESGATRGRSRQLTADDCRSQRTGSRCPPC